eukprot:1137945-Prymnesium_polylepis.2
MAEGSHLAGRWWSLFCWVRHVSVGECSAQIQGGANMSQSCGNVSARRASVRLAVACAALWDTPVNRIDGTRVRSVCDRCLRVGDRALAGSSVQVLGRKMSVRRSRRRTKSHEPYETRQLIRN